MSDKVKQELEYISSQNNGILRPVDVLEYAKKENTALHGCFEWEDSKAAYEYRLWQARQIIRVHVTVLPGSNEPVRAYVSLKTDRYAKDGGYRSINAVLQDESMREQMLSEALEELSVYEDKYKRLSELQPVFHAARKVRQKARMKKDSGELKAAAV